MIVSPCQRTWFSLEGKEDCNSLENNKNRWPWLSPHANGLDCLWKAKETVIVLKTKKKKRMTMIVSVCQQTWLSQKGKEDCNSLENNKSGWPWLSLHANGLDCLWKAKKTVIVFEMIIVRTLSPLKDERWGLWVLWKIKRGLWVLWKIKVRTLSPIKARTLNPMKQANRY